MRAIPDDLKFPYKPKEECKEKPSSTSNFNFLNRALTHTKVACSWDEPDLENKRNEILFKDGMDDKVDLDDYIAPGIDEGYDPDAEEEHQGMDQELATDTENDHINEEDLQNDDESEDLPQVVKKKVISEYKGGKSLLPTKTSAQNVFSDFDKKSRKKTGIKITFKNPLLSGKVEADEEDENPLGKRVYSIKMANKKQHEEAEDEQEDFFDRDENDNYDDDDDEDAIAPVQDKKAKFKDRMKEKKKQAKLKKEQERNEKKAARESSFIAKDNRTADLELIAGDQEEQEYFKPNYDDTRFAGRFRDHEMAIDPTSTMYVKDKHSQINKVRKNKQNHIN